MSERMLGFFKTMVTEFDNLTPDLFRILAVIGIAYFFVLQGLNWRAFDAQSFGLGFSAVLLAVAGAIRINEGARPGTEQPKAPAMQVSAENVTVNQDAKQ